MKVALAVLAAGCALSFAQAEARRDRDGSGAEGPARPTGLPDSPRAITDANRASKIIGREVRNRDHERVGEVRDIVIDVASGKVAYAVLATGRLGSGKLIAMPLDALTPQPAEKSFVLDAPRASWETTQGFAENQWPALDAAADHIGGVSGSSGESAARDATPAPSAARKQ